MTNLDFLVGQTVVEVAYRTFEAEYCGVAYTGGPHEYESATLKLSNGTYVTIEAQTERLDYDYEVPYFEVNLKVDN